MNLDMTTPPAQLAGMLDRIRRLEAIVEMLLTQQGEEDEHKEVQHHDYVS